MIECINLKLERSAVFNLEIAHLLIEDLSVTRIAGSNGSGKTTLLYALMDMLPLDSGVVAINGKSHAEFEDWKNFTGIYLSEAHLMGFLSAWEYLNLVRKLKGISYELFNYQVTNLFSSFFSLELLEKKVLIRDLSKGNQAKVGILAAMLGDPMLLVLDEPFAHLDEASVSSLTDLLTNYYLLGRSIIFTSHTPGTLKNILTDTITLEKGRLIQ